MAQREVERLKEQLASVTTGNCHPAEGSSRVRTMSHMLAFLFSRRQWWKVTKYMYSSAILKYLVLT